MKILLFSSCFFNWMLNKSLDNSSGSYITPLTATSLVKLEEEHRLVPLPGLLISLL